MTHLRAMDNKSWSLWPTDNNVLDYVAGVVDTDGCIQTNEDKTCGSVSLIVKVDQSEKGVDMLHFLHKHFGGMIQLQYAANEKRQASFTWLLLGQYAAKFCETIAPRMLLKKKQAEAAAKFPTINTKIIPYKATNTRSNRVYTFDMKKTCEEHVGFKFKVDDITETYKRDNWIVEKLIKRNEVDKIREERIAIKEELRKLKIMPHDEIPGSFKPSNAYLAGLMDGDGTFDTHGKSGQKHSLTQKYRPICDVLIRLYGGSITYRKDKDAYTWDVYTFAPQFLKDVAPFVVGKQKQVELILNMKPGEASATHAKLHELKGKRNINTKKIDATNQGTGVENNYTAPKTLPKGVYALANRFKVMLNMNKKMTIVGIYDTVAEAEAAYLDVKRRILAAKQAGTPLTSEDLAMKAEEPNAPVSDEVRASLPSGVYVTKANTFQVRGRKNGKVVQLGTHKTIEAALKALANFNADIK